MKTRYTNRVCTNEGCDNPKSTKKNGDLNGSLCCRCNNLDYKYDMTLKERDDMLEFQGNACAICEEQISFQFSTKGSRKHHACVDHCHETDTVRGILCVNCNLGLGKLGDNTEKLSRALTYLISAERNRP